MYDTIFDWVCFQSPWWAKILIIIGYYTFVFIALGVVTSRD